MSTTGDIELMPSEGDRLLESVLGLPLQSKHPIFPSHSGAQKNFVKQLCVDLERQFHHSPFFDKHLDSLPKGEVFPQYIFQAAQQCELAIVVVSEEYFSRSKWPMLELSVLVRSSKRKILPLFFGLSFEEFRDAERRKRWFQTWDAWAQTDPRVSVKDWKLALRKVERIKRLEFVAARGEVGFRQVVLKAVFKLIPPEPGWVEVEVETEERSFISPTYQDSTGNTSPLQRFLQPVPKPPQRWSRGAQIGSGTFGRVYEGLNLDDGTFFAVKVCDSDRIPPEIDKEVEVLSKLRHPNIVQYYGTETKNGSFCIFLELVKMGSLQSIMKNFQVFDEVLMSSYTRQILTGLEYLHDMKIIHRDIKCANILVDANGQVKLADFGLAKQMKESLATSIKGSPYFMALEVLLSEPYGLEADIWSLGCTVLEMADGKPPWSDLQGYAFLFELREGKLPSIPEHLSDTARDFITWCLQKRPEDRPTVKDLLKHPFVAQAPRTFRASFPIGYQL